VHQDERIVADKMINREILVVRPSWVVSGAFALRSILASEMLKNGHRMRDERSGGRLFFAISLTENRGIQLARQGRYARYSACNGIPGNALHRATSRAKCVARAFRTRTS
jgi:hypothetical protein